MKKYIVIALCALMAVQEGFCQWKSIEPSKAEAKVMTTLSEFEYNEASEPTLTIITYANRSGMDLHINVTRQQTDNGQKLPCIVFVQGAAWFKQDLLQKQAVFNEFCKRGYVIAAVEHRPSTTAAFPAQIQDVKSAVRFVRDNADKLGVDAANIFIWGDSSGGNLSLLEVLTQDVKSLDTEGEFERGGLDVNACIAFYPVTDVLRMQEFAPEWMDHTGKDSPTGTLFGHIPVMENPDIVKAASPIEYLSKDKASSTVPILIVTGNRDNVVPYEQSVIFADRLEDCGYNYKFYKIEGGDHGSGEFWSRTVLDIADNFLRVRLK